MVVIWLEVVVVAVLRDKDATRDESWRGVRDAPRVRLGSIASIFLNQSIHSINTAHVDADKIPDVRISPTRRDHLLLP